MTVLGDPPTDGAPDPKPTARIVDRKAFARFFEDKADEPCQCCGIDGWTYSIHHIVSRGQGGDDVPANFALLCGHCTAGCHGDVEARRNGARERLRMAMTPEQIDYVVAKKSWAWLVLAVAGAPAWTPSAHQLNDRRWNVMHHREAKCLRTWQPKPFKTIPGERYDESCESRLYTYARNASGASGLFQLMPVHWQGSFDPFNPWANSRYALRLSSNGYDWGAWICQP